LQEVNEGLFVEVGAHLQVEQGGQAGRVRSLIFIAIIRSVLAVLRGLNVVTTEGIGIARLKCVTIVALHRVTGEVMLVVRAVVWSSQLIIQQLGKHCAGHSEIQS